ncbi:calcium-binding protein [Roseibium sp. RKSG952]|uniref:calcium-binding protein n=1 Tax=Roseibium sp. RKSG952 TaxID=2529384 RepID=UPI0034CE8DF7
MTTYTYDETTGYYVTDDGVQVSSDAYAAIVNYESEGTVYAEDGWAFIVDYGVYQANVDEEEIDNSYVYNSGEVLSFWMAFDYYGLVVGSDEDNIFYSVSYKDLGDTYVEAKDVIYFAGLGDDIAYGYEGDDTFYGEEGDDILYGGDGDDSLYGGDGNDWLYSGSLFDGESDILTGGAGADTFILGDVADTSTSTTTTVEWDDVATSVTKTITTILASATGISAVSWVNTAAWAVLSNWDTIDSATVSTESGDPTPGYAQITDFNPTEDVLVIPIYSSTMSNVWLDDSTDNGGWGFAVAYDNGDSSDIVADINFADASEVFGDDVSDWSEEMVEAFYYSMRMNAIVVTSDGEAYGFKSNGSIDYTGSDSLSGTSYIIMGASYGWYVYGTHSDDMLVGDNYDDVIYGYIPDSSIAGYAGAQYDGNDQIYGFDGDDWIQGGAGDDYIFGGDGSDTSAYTDSISGITVDLSTTYEDSNGTYALADDGFGDTDRLYSIENIWGSDSADSITGDDGDNTLYGFGGDDVIYGGSGDDHIDGGNGSDYLDGGAGTDTLYFLNTDDGIIVDLSAETVSDDGFGNIDTVINFENVYGTDYDDTITGDDGDNVLFGADGDDTIYGGDGDDVLVSGDGANELYGGDGEDVLISTGDGDILTGGDGADTFIVAGGTNVTITDFNEDEGDSIIFYYDEYAGTTTDEDGNTTTIDGLLVIEYTDFMGIELVTGTSELSADSYLAIDGYDDADLSYTGGLATYESGLDLSVYDSIFL